MTAVDVGILCVRLAVGVTFAAHGAQKVFGWWGGPGFGGWSAGITRMGLRPARLWAAISSGIELVCGSALVLGLLTPVASALLVAQSTYIVVRAHLPRGFWSRDRGIEFPIQLLAGSLLVTATRAGAISLDGVLGLTLDRTVRIVVLVIALAGAVVAMAMARPQPQPAPRQQA